MLNQCQFIGHLGRDPEVRNFANGGQVCNLRLACTEKWKDANGERKEMTEWVSVSVFSEGLVRVCEQYLKKGSKIYVSGKLRTRKYQDQSGADKYSTEVVLQGFGGTLTMLDGRDDSAGSGHSQQNSGGGYDQGGGYGGQGGGARDLDDEIPL